MGRPHTEEKMIYGVFNNKTGDLLYQAETSANKSGKRVSGMDKCRRWAHKNGLAKRDKLSAGGLGIIAWHYSDGIEIRTLHKVD